MPKPSIFWAVPVIAMLTFDDNGRSVLGTPPEAAAMAMRVPRPMTRTNAVSAPVKKPPKKPSSEPSHLVPSLTG